MASRNRLCRGSLARLLFALGITVLGVIAPASARANEELPASLTGVATTHQQVSTIALDSNMRLADFCLSPDGQILALANGQAKPGLIAEVISAVAGTENESPSKTSELHVYSADGTLVKKWTIDFEAQAINAGPDGSIFVGGDGQLARYDIEGKQVAHTWTPQAKSIRENPDVLRKQAEEHLEAEQASIGDQVQSLKDQKEQLDGKEKESITDEEKQFLAIYEPQVQAYENYLKTLKAKTVERAMQEIAQRVMKINAIAVGEEEIFVACPTTKGFGYAVWRSDKDLKDSKQIIDSLSGCCGQMDIQVTGGKLYVAENSRHHVACYDREGKQVSTFGKRDRDALECFGGCCNPMNICFTTEGNLYVAESNGIVKHFTPSGDFKGLVGVAKVPAGCKNSAIAATKDGSHVYYIDITNSKIIVLARTEQTAAVGK